MALIFCMGCQTTVLVFLNTEHQNKQTIDYVNTTQVLSKIYIVFNFCCLRSGQQVQKECHRVCFLLSMPVMKTHTRTRTRALTHSHVCADELPIKAILGPLPEVLESSSPVLSNMAATNYMWLLSTWHVASSD